MPDAVRAENSGRYMSSTLAAGCVNLSAIREFASISADSVGYRRLVRDYVTLPEQQARYRRPCTECELRAAQRREQEAGLLLEQAALQTGALAAAVSTTMAFDPLSSLVFGIVLFDEALHETAFGITMSLISLGVALAGLVLVSIG